MALSHALAFVRTAVKRWQGYVWAGRLSREILVVQGADALKLGGRPCPRRRFRESSWDPARSENLGTHGISMRENREIPRSPAGVDDAPSWMVRGVAGRRSVGREGNALAVSPR